jgi:BioD-like phosphotransacetylase family protein
LANYWDLGDKAAAQHFTEDFLKFLLPGLKIRAVALLDKDAVKEAFKSEVKSDHVVKVLLEDGREIEQQDYHHASVLPGREAH